MRNLPAHLTRHRAPTAGAPLNQHQLRHAQTVARWHHPRTDGTTATKVAAVLNPTNPAPRLVVAEADGRHWTATHVIDHGIDEAVQMLRRNGAPA